MQSLNTFLRIVSVSFVVTFAFVLEGSAQRIKHNIESLRGLTGVMVAIEDLKPDIALPLIEPLMLDDSQYVQKGIGTLLRGLWKTYPVEIEEFLLKWKDQCGRLIVQYTTEKMDKEYRKKFRKI